MPLAFHEVRLPEAISWGATGGPEFSTTVVTFTNGKEQRNSNWSRGRASWNVSVGIKTIEEMAVLVSFFRERRGKACGFRFKDWLDHELIDQPMRNVTDDTFVGDGSTQEFQVVKTYDSALNLPPALASLNPEYRTIIKLRGGASDPVVTVPVVVKLDGTPLIENTDYFVSYDLGSVFFNSPVPLDSVVTFSGEYDVPARFNTDKMEVNIDDFNAQSWGGIDIIELTPLDFVE